MFNKNRIFQSPIALRLFALFIASSILPLTVLIFLSWVVMHDDSSIEIWNMLGKFKFALLILTFLYLIFLLILNIRQIRQILFPLQKLQAGTRDLANQKFNSKINITTGDEFEQLAHSFNHMSSRLGKQFNALEMMARIDRLILSTLDIESIVETILIRMKHIVPCDTVSVIITKEKSPQQATIYYRNDPLSTTISSSEIVFRENEFKQLHTHRDSILIDNNDLTPHFLYPLRTNNLAFLLLPIFLQTQLSAVIVLGYHSKPSYSSEDYNNAKDLAHRVAVALSNAAWEDKLYHQAHHDTLTDLPNRLLFQDRLKQAIARATRDETLVALLFIDLDRFKLINDSLGHEIGDLLLTEVANRLKKNTRVIDTVSRLGGDEFTIILPDLQNVEESITDIANIAKKILNAISIPYLSKGQELNFTCSIGIALFPRDSDNFLDLLRNADSAMFFAKTKGKHIFQFYSENLNVEAKSNSQSAP